MLKKRCHVLTLFSLGVVSVTTHVQRPMQTDVTDGVSAIGDSVLSNFSFLEYAARRYDYDDVLPVIQKYDEQFSELDWNVKHILQIANDVAFYVFVCTAIITGLAVVVTLFSCCLAKHRCMRGLYIAFAILLIICSSFISTAFVTVSLMTMDGKEKLSEDFVSSSCPTASDFFEVQSKLAEARAVAMSKLQQANSTEQKKYYEEEITDIDKSSDILNSAVGCSGMCDCICLIEVEITNKNRGYVSSTTSGRCGDEYHSSSTAFLCLHVWCFVVWLHDSPGVGGRHGHTPQTRLRGM